MGLGDEFYSNRVIRRYKTLSDFLLGQYAEVIKKFKYCICIETFKETLRCQLTCLPDITALL